MTDSYALIPLRTHLISAGEDIVDVVCQYVRGVATSGDVVAISESAVAVSQGRAVLSRGVKPGFLARFLCRFPQKHGSLATPQAMQLAISEAGVPRVLAAAVVGGLAKAVGIRGLFYRIAGRGLAAIDDIAGTLYPFDEHIVLAPRDGQAVVDAIRDRTGLEAAIVDVNDIRCVDFMAATRNLDRAAVARALERNPMGNDDEQTPIVVLKRLSTDPVQNAG
ncbi:MAG: F420-0:Gamma-glutamyl ligase [Firmicutes bacterium]|nr:F420-0:Gamma-glutamyl ligase [Bacillota bacterium]